MIRSIRFAATVILALALAGCAARTGRTRVDPFPLRLPLVEAGSLEIEGHVVGQPRVRDGIIRYLDQKGYLTEIVVSSRALLRRDTVILSGPESLPLDGEITAGPVLVRDGDGRLKGTLSGYSDGLLVAGDGKGRWLWEFKAAAGIPADPAVAGGRVYFGDSDRYFYGLDAATGKLKWKRRLQGAPLHPAVVAGRRVAVVASNSTLYFLSGRGGSILSWAAIPSRIVYEPARAGTSLLVSPAADRLLVFDLRTGERIGQHLTSGTLAAGAVWSPPFVVLVEEDAGTGRQRLVFLRSR